MSNDTSANGTDRSGADELHCPKCGERAHNAYGLLGHIYSNHWILDDDELPEGYLK